MSEKPRERLVSKGEYVGTLTRKTLWFSASVFTLALTLLMLFISLIFVVFACYQPSEWPLLFTALFAGCISLTAGISTRYFVQKGQKIASVKPMTRHAVSGLTPEEILVRPSDLPPSHQQNELLRAAPIGSETSPSQLLRATTEDRSHINSSGGCK